MGSKFDVTAARSAFPALQQEQIFMDNAGGWMLQIESWLVWYIWSRVGLTPSRRKSGSWNCGRLVSLLILVSLCIHD